MDYADIDAIFGTPAPKAEVQQYLPTPPEEDEFVTNSLTADAFAAIFQQGDVEYEPTVASTEPDDSRIAPTQPESPQFNITTTPPKKPSAQPQTPPDKNLTTEDYSGYPSPMYGDEVGLFRGVFTCEENLASYMHLEEPTRVPVGEAPSKDCIFVQGTWIDKHGAMARFYKDFPLPEEFIPGDGTTAKDFMLINHHWIHKDSPSGRKAIQGPVMDETAIMKQVAELVRKQPKSSMPPPPRPSSVPQPRANKSANAMARPPSRVASAGAILSTSNMHRANNAQNPAGHLSLSERIVAYRQQIQSFNAFQQNNRRAQYTKLASMQLQNAQRKPTSIASSPAASPTVPGFGPQLQQVSPSNKRKASPSPSAIESGPAQKRVMTAANTLFASPTPNNNVMSQPQMFAPNSFNMQAGQMQWRSVPPNQTFGFNQFPQQQQQQQQNVPNQNVIPTPFMYGGAPQNPQAAAAMMDEMSRRSAIFNAQVQQQRRQSQARRPVGSADEELAEGDSNM